MDFFRFSMDFFGFLCAGGGCRTPPHFLGLGTPVRSWACQRRPSQSFTKAWRKRTSRMPGDFCVYGFCWNSLWLHQIINDSVWIIWIFIYFYWLPADFLQFPMMSCVFHIISALSYGFLSRSHGCPCIYLDSCSLSIDSHGLQTNCYELVVFLWVESFNVFRLLRMFIHFDLENTILLRVNACFVLVFAGITRIPDEIHSVFKQKMISKWANKSKSEISLSMSDLLHTPY